VVFWVPWAPTGTKKKKQIKNKSPDPDSFLWTGQVFSNPASC
jgi:hypothetical protein